MADKPIVLFLCIHNSGRSLAARVLLDHYAQGRIDVRSAGSEPADQLNPSIVALLVERGLDPSKEFPKPLDAETARNAVVIVTMGCGDTCPVYPASVTLTGSSKTQPANPSTPSGPSSTRSTVSFKR
jgi:arsenate reductase